MHQSTSGRTILNGPPQNIHREAGPMAERTRRTLFDVLRLLADTLELILAFDDEPRCLDIVGLAADGVNLATDLLQQKLEFTANRVGAGQQLPEMLKMAAE